MCLCLASCASSTFGERSADGERRVQPRLSVGERDLPVPEMCEEGLERRRRKGGGGGGGGGEKQDVQTWVRVGPLGKPSNSSALSGQQEASLLT